MANTRQKNTKGEQIMGTLNIDKKFQATLPSLSSQEFEGFSLSEFKNPMLISKKSISS